MRFALACVLVAGLHGAVAADAKIDQTARFYEKQISSCKKNARGVAVVLERGKPVAGSDSDLAADLEELEKAHAILQGHCDDIAAMVTFLRSDSSAKYDQIKKDIAERDKKIREGRAATKQTLADSQPLISRSIPRINKLIAQADAAARLSTREQKAAAEKEHKAAEKVAADKAATEQAVADKAAAKQAAVDKAAAARQAAADKYAADKAAKQAAADKAAADKAAAKQAAAEKAAAEKAAGEKAAAERAKLTAKFPSGRAVELPAPLEAWTLSGTADTDIADYAFAGAKATVIVRARAGSPSCDQIRASMTLVAGRSAPQAIDASAELKAIKPAWVLGWTQDDRQVRAVCVASKHGAVVGRTEVGIVGNAPIDTALARILMLRLKR